MADIFLVECSAEKCDGQMPARDLYVSERFGLARKVAEQVGDTWYVVSALHGLLSPAAVIRNYNVDLRTFSSERKNDWADRVYASIQGCCGRHDRLTVLCSDDYSEPLLSRDLARNYATRLPFLSKTRQQQCNWLRGTLGESDRAKHLNRFYELLRQMDAIEGHNFGSRCFTEGIPPKGVYYFFEPSEYRLTHEVEARVVRVGTHGVSAGSKSSLTDRINTHFGTRNGSGNHRSSIMRLHIGAAMLASGTLEFDVPTWGSKTRPDGPSRLLEERLEDEVSSFIRRMRFICLAICDAASARSDRAYVEQNSIALLSGAEGPLDVADSKWLGSRSPKDEIRASSLWNVECVGNTYDPDFLDTLEQYVRITHGQAPLPVESIAPSYWYEARRGRESKGQKRLF